MGVLYPWLVLVGDLLVVHTAYESASDQYRRWSEENFRLGLSLSSSVQFYLSASPLSWGVWGGPMIGLIPWARHQSFMRLEIYAPPPCRCAGLQVSVLFHVQRYEWNEQSSQTLEISFKYDRRRHFLSSHWWKIRNRKNPHVTAVIADRHPNEQFPKDATLYIFHDYQNDAALNAFSYMLDSSHHLSCPNTSPGLSLAFLTDG